MTHYLISFPGAALQVAPEDLPAVGEAARQVVRDAKAAGVYVFGGGINEDVPSVMVRGDGRCSSETYPQTREFDGGFMVLKLPDRAAALHWAARTAAACRCAQELREFMFDPEC